jgi:CPA2 family monovalent cation:H+ antiporter-2
VLVKLMGRPVRRALEVGLILSAGGEFAFVVMGQAMACGPCGGQTWGQILVLIATLSMFAIPALTMLGERIGRSAARPALAAEPPAQVMAPGSSPEALARPPKVLVIGYGRVGLMVADMLDRHQIAWVAVDQDAKAVEAARRRGHAVYFGNASRVEFLRRCGLDGAAAVVVTMDNAEAVEAVVAAARQARPQT